MALTKLATIALTGVALAAALGYDVIGLLAAFAESKLGYYMQLAAAGIGAVLIFVGLIVLFIASGYKGMIKDNKINFGKLPALEHNGKMIEQR